MIQQGSRPRSFGVAGVIALLALALIYGAALRHLALDKPSFDASSMQRKVEEMRARPGAPLDPLPLIGTTDSTLLHMARDPFAPQEARSTADDDTPRP
jgi:hypothetical protein